MRLAVLLRWSQLAWFLVAGAVGASPLFDDDAVLDIELHGPIGETLDDTRNRAERPFTLIVDGVALDVMVRVRGKSRTVACRFPPMRLRFSDAANTVFAGQDKLKLVTHCNSARNFETNLLEEYAAYRVMGLLTEASLRVRLLRIRYVDTNRPRRSPLMRFGFVLESSGAMAERLGGWVVNRKGVPLSLLRREHTATVFVAQYLIGNTDWSLVRAEGEESCCHNGILVEIGDGRLYYVPYDFDMSAMVDAPYARPQAGAGSRRTRLRRYAGYCFDDLDLPAAIRRVRDARELIFAEMQVIDALSPHKLKSSIRYLEGFFRAAEDPERLAERFAKNCIGG